MEENTDAVVFDRNAPNWDAYCSPVEVMLVAVPVIDDVAFDNRFSIWVVNPTPISSILELDWFSAGMKESETEG